jgi:hypothetical protein
MNTDTPLPQEEPAGQNPPDGAIIDYYLKGNNELVTLEITDSKGKLIRKYSSKDKPYTVPENNVPPYWLRPQQILSSEVGAHRFTWDLHYQPLDVSPTYPIAAVYKNTAPNTTSPWVLPGVYTVILTAGGKGEQQTLVVKMDPRVKIAAKDLQVQHDLSVQAYKSILQIDTIMKEIKAARVALKNRGDNKYKALEEQLSKLENTQRGNGIESFTTVGSGFSTLLDLLQDADAPPTTQAAMAMKNLQLSMAQLLLKWGNSKEEMKRIK